MNGRALHDVIGRLQGRLRRLVRMFEARAPRERAILVVAVGALSVMLADALWLTRSFARVKAAEQRVHTAQAAQAALRADADTVAAQGSAQAQQLQGEIAQARRRVQQTDAALQAHQRALISAEQMVELLEQMLPAHGRVRVVALRSLPRSDLLAEPANSRGPVPALYRHGVELTIEGNYADLMDYLKALETMPRRVLWGGLQMKVEQHPRVQLTIRLHTLSLDRGWLEI